MVALMVMSVSSAILYWHSSDITNKQLPYTLELNRLSESVTASLDALNNWVLLGNVQHKQKRKVIWHERIFPSLKTVQANIGRSGNTFQRKQFEELSTKLNTLYTSQWWVEDVSQYIGNQPSLVIYQRDLLPIYYRIQSALSGIVETDGESTPANELKLTISNTHLLLTETIHQISEIILTGEMAHLNRFKFGAAQVSIHLADLKSTQTLSPDSKILIDWVERQYQVYISLANDVTETRQASDWNRAIYMISTETEDLTNQIKQLLLDIQNTHIRKLEDDTEWAESATFIAFILALFLLFLTMTTAILLTGGNARRMVRQILELRKAAKDLALGKQNKIDIVYDDELGELAKVFNQMQSIILRRRKKFVRERERLAEVVRIVTHDIKSPLINISGHSEMIFSEVAHAAENPETLTETLPVIESCVSHVKLATTRINELIEGILKFSSTVHKEITLEKMPLSEIIDELLELNSARLKNANVTIGRIPSEIHCDSFAFKFIFSTLLDNAIKYQSVERPLTLEIGFSLNEAEELWILSIRDNGIGIDDVQKEGVFKMFSRHHPDLEIDGYGIGLPCARSMAERLNGDICFSNNNDGPGVTFFVELHYHNNNKI